MRYFLQLVNHFPMTTTTADSGTDTPRGSSEYFGYVRARSLFWIPQHNSGPLHEVQHNDVNSCSNVMSRNTESQNAEVVS